MGADYMFSEISRDFREMHKRHGDLYGEFLRLLAEPSAKVPTKGNRVVVAAGLLCMGHPWVRLEAVVLECGETSYKVKFADPDYGEVQWVHQALIVEVLE